MSPAHDLATAALAHAARGWSVFPCNPETKQPLTKHGLKDATIEPGQVAAWWRRWPSAMIGVATGPTSGLWAVDLDVDEEVGLDGAAALETVIPDSAELPTTLRSRTPRGGSHILFKWTPGIRNSAGKIAPGVDVRGEGGYVIAPPSVRADGAAYRWATAPEAVEPADAPDWLLDVVRQPPVASPTLPAARPRAGANQRYAEAALDDECAKLARTGAGGRNAALNSAAFNLGQLVGSGDLDEARVRVRLLDAATACDLVADDGVRSVEATIASGLRGGAEKPREPLKRERREGRRRRTSTLSDEGAPRTPCGLTRAGSDDGELPVVRVVAGELPRVVDEAEAALIASGTPLFSRAGALVRPIAETIPAARGRTTTVARFKEVCADTAVDLLSRVAEFQRYDKRSEDWATVDPPAKVAALLLAREGEWRVRRAVGILTTPTLRQDGTVLSAPGYDVATGLYLALDRDLSLPAISSPPTRADAEAALARLVDLLAGFPFVAPVDRAVALSGILTSVVRGAMTVAPLHAIRAHSAGTGKSYLVDVASMIATGRLCPVIAAGKTEEETEKRLGSLLRDAVPIVSLDNVNGELGGDALCQMTERPLVRIRILGKTETPEFECKATIFATGNNLTLVGDMTRRTILCSLDAGLERPELRDFAFDPVARVAADRGNYVAAALTIAMAYRAAGSPGVCNPIGSYGEWSATVRAPLIWLGEADPVASMETARDEDPELAAIRELFSHWRTHLAAVSPYTTAGVIETAVERSQTGEFIRAEFRDLLLRVAGDGGAVSSRRLGKWLSKISGRIVDRTRLTMRSDGSHGNRFALGRPE